MTSKELLMAAYWLRQASDLYANHGCNDLPKEFAEEMAMTPSEKIAFATEYETFNGSLEDALLDGPIKPSRFDDLPDYCVMSLLAHKLANRAAETAGSEAACTCPSDVWASDGSDANDSTCNVQHDSVPPDSAGPQEKP